MNPIILALAPIIVSLLTGALKRLPLFSDMTDSWRTGAIRFLAVALSFISALLGAWVSGTEVDATSIQTFADALVVFLGSTGAYLIASRK